MISLLKLFFLFACCLSCTVRPIKNTDREEIYDIPTEETSAIKKQDASPKDDNLDDLEFEEDEKLATDKRPADQQLTPATPGLQKKQEENINDDLEKELDFEQEPKNNLKQKEKISPLETKVDLEKENRKSSNQSDGPILANRRKNKRQKIAGLIKITPTNPSLIFAAKNGTIETLKRLLDLGLDINYQNKLGETALMTAVKYKRYGNVKYLLSKGARKEMQNNAGLTPLQQAQEMRANRIIKLLSK